MKLIVTGKGGSGKSTVAALIAKQYARFGMRVVVVDTDVSLVLGTHCFLGTALPQDMIDYFGGSVAVRDRMKLLRNSGAQSDEPHFGTWTYDTIPESFCTKNNGITLVTIGKLRDSKIACKSPWMAIARQFVLGMQLGKDEVLIVDADAGIDHFGRGIDSVCDFTIMVIDPTHESVRLAERALEMAQANGSGLFFILNKTNETTSEFLRKALPHAEKILGELPHDSSLLSAGFSGTELPDIYPAAELIYRAVCVNTNTMLS